MGRCTVEVHSWLYTGKLQRQDCPQIRDIRTQLLASSQNFVFGIVDGCTGRTERRWQHWSPPEGSLTESHGCSHGCILLGKPQTHCSNTRLHTLISQIWKRTNFSSTFSSQAEVQSEKIVRVPIVYPIRSGKVLKRHSRKRRNQLERFDMDSSQNVYCFLLFVFQSYRF